MCLGGRLRDTINIYTNSIPENAGAEKERENRVITAEKLLFISSIHYHSNLLDDRYDRTSANQR